MNAGMLAGFGLGLGLLLVGIGLWPAKPSIGSALAPLRVTGRQLGQPAEVVGWRAELGRNASGMFELLGLRFNRYRSDLAITGKTVEWLCAEKVISGVVLFLVVPALIFVLDLVLGMRFSWQLQLGVMVALGALGFFLPDQNLKDEAAKRRQSFRHAVSAYLDLVAISLAGGAAAEEALRNALAHGQGWSFERLRRALHDAQIAGVTPWDALGRLGDELDIRELTELASSISLAGTEGATIRGSLIEKAASSRSHRLSEAEEQAATATDRMVIPLVVLLAGFVVFVTYPALSRVLTSL